MFEGEISDLSENLKGGERAETKGIKVRKSTNEGGRVKLDGERDREVQSWMEEKGWV